MKDYEITTTNMRKIIVKGASSEEEAIKRASKGFEDMEEVLMVQSNNQI